jgi:hypothetical protein
MRKDSGLQLDDRIVTFYEGDDAVNEVVEEWSAYIEAETLSLELVAGPVPGDTDAQVSFALGGHSITFGIKRE